MESSSKLIANLKKEISSLETSIEGARKKKENIEKELENTKGTRKYSQDIEEMNAKRTGLFVIIETWQIKKDVIQKQLTAAEEDLRAQLEEALRSISSGEGDAYRSCSHF
jgi:SMC interacting uncharacterized protein involved in chromosome segregation